MHKLRHTAIALSLALAAGCGDSTVSQPAGDFTVRVFNGSPVAVSNIRVRVSEQDEFTVARLEHGDMSGTYAVRAMHTNPAVTLTVSGETLTSIPIEGFSGFNPALARGAYVVTVTVTGAPRRLDVSVQQPVEN
jgi:hypothetical protein